MKTVLWFLFLCLFLGIYLSLFKSSHDAFLAISMVHFSRLFFSVNFYFIAIMYYSKLFLNVSLLMLSFMCMHVFCPSVVWLWNSIIDCSPPCSSVHRILQERILEWATISSSRDVPDPGIEHSFAVSPAFAGRFFTTKQLGSDVIVNSNYHWPSFCYIAATIPGDLHVLSHLFIIATLWFKNYIPIL